MNHETATDFELNKRLAELRGLSFHVFETCSLGGVDYIGVVKIILPPVDARLSDCDYADFNPCNNWSDIMPIAVELGVYYTPTGDFTAVQKVDDDYSYFGYTQAVTPQRALVICCIKVLESKVK